MNEERFPWKEVAREHAAEFSALLVAGALVERVRDAQRQGVVADRAPSPFGREPRCEHADACFIQAQFWQAGSLWRHIGADGGRGRMRTERIGQTSPSSKRSMTGTKPGSLFPVNSFPTHQPETTSLWSNEIPMKS